MNLWTEDQILSKAALAELSASQRTGSISRRPIPSDNPDRLLPAMSFGGITNAATITYDGRFPMVDDSTLLQLSDSVTKIWRNHTFKAGLFLAHRLYNQYHQAGGNSFPGSFAFGTDSSNPLDSGYAYANAILGNYDTYVEATNRVNYAPITKNAEWYIQDHWRIAPAVDHGYRPSDDRCHPDGGEQQQCRQLRACALQSFAGPGLVSSRGGQWREGNRESGERGGRAERLFRPDRAQYREPSQWHLHSRMPGFPNYSNGVLFAPRLGIAWDPFGDGKTAVRLGGGIFYAGIPDAGTLGNLFFNPPAIYTPTAYYGTVATAANSPACSLRAASRAISISMPRLSRHTMRTSRSSGSSGAAPW